MALKIIASETVNETEATAMLNIKISFTSAAITTMSYRPNGKFD